MPEWLSALVVALIGLAASLTAVAVGYWQWSQGNREKKEESLRESTREVYEGLWKLVEDAHVELRRDPESYLQLEKRIGDVNSYVLRNELYLADDVHELVNRYLKALGEMASWARQQADTETKVAMHNTGRLPSGVTAIARALELREQLKNHVRDAVRA